MESLIDSFYKFVDVVLIEHFSINKLDKFLHEFRLLTAPDVARILNISKGAAYPLIQQKKIPSVRINRNVRVRQEDLDEFISNNAV